MTNMNNLQEALNHLVKHDTLVFMYGGKQTLFAMYGINKVSIAEPVVILDNNIRSLCYTRSKTHKHC